MWRAHVAFRSLPAEVIPGRMVAGVLHHPVVGEMVLASVYGPCRGSGFLSDEQADFLTAVFQYLRS